MFPISDEEFEAIRALVQAKTGIKLGDAKRALVIARLGKRLRHHGYGTFREYHQHLRERDADGRELLEMINSITTNKTEFFREGHHFEWLRNQLVPEIRARAHARGKNKLRIWSAGCSTGQEPYSIAMVLADELPKDWDVRVLASDIDTNVLAEARAGEYSPATAADIPEPLRSKYLEQRGRGLRIARGIREMVTFRRINLNESPWPIQIRFDAIFCRNVTIYFDRETQSRLYERLAGRLEPHGYLVAGHSENLHWLGHLLSPVGGTVYRPTSRAGQRALSRRPTRVLRDVAIQSGGLHASAEPVLVRTVLGSCVAACLFDPEARVGGMNHFMLPKGCESDWVPTRFGEHAMDTLLAEIAKLGGQGPRLKAKIFGGAHVLRISGSSRAIPDDNVDFVRRFLQEKKIPIVAERVGGDLPMTLHFETDTGRALVRVVANNEADAVAERETRYLETLSAAAREGESLLLAAGRSGA